MTKQKRTRIQFLGLISLALIISAVSYGFALGNTDSPGAGVMLFAGYGVISPAEVENISYVLDEANPTSFVAVKFRMDGFDDLQAGISPKKDGPVTWADQCELTGVFWCCSFDASISVLEADWLHVEPD